MSRALWRAILPALLGALAPAAASASLPSWRDSRLLDAELRRETPLPASSEIKAAAPHVHGVFCPHALPKTRVRGFELGLHCSIGGEAGLTCTSRPAYALRYGGHALERSVFTGYLWDKETNLFFAKARFYDPQVGRFTSQDSYLGQVDEPPSLHRYFYANDNPTTFVDPTGHFSIKDFAKGAVNVALEPFREVSDVIVSGYAAAKGIDADDIQLDSMLGKAQRERVLEGQSAATAAAKGIGETAFAVGTLGVGPAAVQHVELAQAYNRGELTIDQYDAALSEMAGGQTAGAALAKLAGGRAGARAGASTELQVQPKGAGAVRIIEGNRGAVPVTEGAVATTEGGLPAARPLPRAAGGSPALEPGPAADAGTLSRTTNQGQANNIKGAVFENILESASRRQGEMPFFRSPRRGGMDFGLLDEGTVALREAKFANRLQYDDFTAITKNLKSNIREIVNSLEGNPNISRADKHLIRTTLEDFLQGNKPPNLKIDVVTGKSAVGSRLQDRLRQNVGGLPIDFRTFP